MESGRLKLQPYSTTHLPPAERHEAWSHRDWPSLAPAYHTVPLEPFDTEAASLRLGEISVHYSRITGQRWTRDQKMMRSFDPDALTVVITVAGTAHGVAGDRSFRSGPGSVHFSDLSMPSDHESTASRTLLVGVPRKLAERNGLNVRSLHGSILNGGPAELIAPFLLGLRRAAPSLAVDDGPRLGKVVVDLVGVAAAGGRDSRPDFSGRHSAAAFAARREIENSLGSHSLNVASLCRRLNISRSTLHRLFETEGGVQAYIRERRLEAARVVLADPGNSDHIYVIAERLGFSDAAHLSRLFRERFDHSPREYRVRSRNARDDRGA